MLFKNLLFVEYLSFRDEGSYCLATDSAAGLRFLIVSVWWYRESNVGRRWYQWESSHNHLFDVLLHPSSSEQRDNAIASSSRLTPINDTNLSATYPLPANYANDHNQLLQCFQVCCIATIRKPDCVHSYELRLIILHWVVSGPLLHFLISYLLIRSSALFSFSSLPVFPAIDI